jgi:chemotaxis protein methyltransferase CheR
VISLAADTPTAYDAPAGRAISADEFEYVRGLVHAHAAIALETGKEYLVESRLGPLARVEGFGSVPAMIERLRGSRVDDLHRRAVEAMTNNETLFFRDPRPFAMLEHAILPELVERLAARRTLHVWCAACSTGQEPYSLAMLLAGWLPPLAGWNVCLRATDLSRTALARARAGRYSQFEVDRGVPAPLRNRYFERQGADWSVTGALRRMVTFDELNLAHPWPVLPRMDLIVMRNVLIYLDPAARKQIVARVARQLAPGGYLMLGGSETLAGLDGLFETMTYEGAACFRVAAPG